MACCDGWNNYPKDLGESKIRSCPDCGEDVDDDGYAMSGCNYSSVLCETCGDAPCDQSC
jgi:hypothetical protein